MDREQMIAEEEKLKKKIASIIFEYEKKTGLVVSDIRLYDDAPLPKSSFPLPKIVQIESKLWK